MNRQDILISRNFQFNSKLINNKKTGNNTNIKAYISSHYSLVRINFKSIGIKGMTFFLQKSVGALEQHHPLPPQ